MDIGADTGSLQRTRLLRAPACQDGKSRPDLEDSFQLFGAQILRHKGKNPDTPRPVPQERGGLFEEALTFRLAQKSHSQKRQSARP